MLAFVCSILVCMYICNTQTEKMLSAAEEVVGEYLWGQYDILLLPSSFPYGGMENPCLTFLHPSLLVSYVHLHMHKIVTGNTAVKTVIEGRCQ